MAVKKYAYYIKGNKIALAQMDTVDNSSSEYGRYKSPTETVDKGLEIEYTYAPTYHIPNDQEVDANKFYINGWTIVDGYLVFIRHRNSGPANWTSSPEDVITSGTAGNTGGQSLDYIVVRGSNRWNGIHRVKTAGTNGLLTTYTKVSGLLPNFPEHDINAAKTVNQFYYGGLPLVYLADYFSAGDYMYVTRSAGAGTGYSSAYNSGLFRVSAVTPDTSAAQSKVTVDMRYVVPHSGSASAVNGLDTEYAAAAGLIDADESTQDINIYKAHRDFCYILTDVNVLNDENDEIHLLPYQSKAVVYYLKAKLAEDAGEFKMREYFLKEFRKQIEKNNSAKKHGPSIVQGNNIITGR